MKKAELKAALDLISKKIALMTDVEFRAELEKHKDGDIARIIRYSRMLDVHERGVEV